MLNRNLVAIIVIVAMVLVGCGGGGDSPAVSESDTGPVIVGGSDSGSRDDDAGVVGSPDVEDSTAVVSGSETDATADADGGSRADGDAGLGDRWPWCWNWAAVQAQSERVSAELVVLLEKRDAFNATERPDASSFEKARAEAAYQEAQDAYDAVESALERLKAGLDDALEQAQAAALANGDEDAYSAADIVLAMRQDQEQFRWSSIAPVIAEKLAEAPQTVFQGQFGTVMSEILIAQSWYDARESSQLDRARAANQAAVAATEVGYMDAPIWAAWAVAAVAASDATTFLILAIGSERSDNSGSQTYWIDEAAKATEWAVAAADAVTFYYTAEDTETRQSAIEWAASIADEAPSFSRMNSGRHYTTDLPSPPAPPQAVTEAMRILAEREAAAANRSVGPDEPAPAEPRAEEPPPVPIGGTPIPVQTPSPRELAIETITELAETTDRSSRNAYGTIGENLTAVIVTELCKS